MAYQSKTYSLKQLSYIPLMCAGAIIAGIGIVNDYGLLDELLVFVGSFVFGYALAAFRS